MISSDIPAVVTEIIGTVLELYDLPQGMTSTVTLAQTERGKFIVKRAEGALYGGWLSKEYRALLSLAGLDVDMRLSPLPHVSVRDDTGIVPVRWLAMEYIPGITLDAALHQNLDPGYRSGLIRNFGKTLAKLHATPPPVDMSSHGISWLDSMLDEAEENLEHFNVDGTPQLLARLRSTKPLSTAPVLIHGDFSIDNVVVHDDQIAGVIDWSGASIGDPRYDLALATRPQGVAFSDHRQHDLEAFYAGYGTEPLLTEICNYFLGLYEFF